MTQFDFLTLPMGSKSLKQACKKNSSCNFPLYRPLTVLCQVIIHVKLVDSTSYIIHQYDIYGVGFPEQD